MGSTAHYAVHNVRIDMSQLCPVCFDSIKDGTSFCMSCGTKVEAAASSGSAPSLVEQATTADVQPTEAPTVLPRSQTIATKSTLTGLTGNKRRASLLSVIAVFAALVGLFLGSRSTLVDPEVSESLTSESTQVQDGSLIRALGLWEIEKNRLPVGAIPGPLVAADGDFFGFALTSVVDPSGEEIDRCWEEEEIEAGTVEILRLQGEGFTSFQTMKFLGEWIEIRPEPILAVDVTKDGTDEVIIRSDCMAYPNISALRFEGGQWNWFSLGGASILQNGQLLRFDKDCMPSCADGGVDWTAYEWNGESVVAVGPVTSEGEPVNLTVEMTCTTFFAATALPLQQCSEGPIVRQFLALAGSVIGNYSSDASVSHRVNKFDEKVAQWVLTYRHRHGLPATKEIDQRLFAALGDYWEPETDAERALFNRYCDRYYGYYECERYRYLMPTNECATYREATQPKWPIKRCDYDGWVSPMLAALSIFDGQSPSSDSILRLFDEAVELRIRSFQRAMGLQVDGYVGRNTWRALASIPGSPLVPRPGYEDLNGDGFWGPGDILE